MKNQMSAKSPAKTGHLGGSATMPAKLALSGKKLLVFASLFFVATTANAAELMAPGKDQNPNFVVSASESHKNLYVAAPNLTINGNTSGDLTAVGGTVTLEGKVESGLLLAGGNLFINGPIGANARVVGGNINISTSVGGDLVIAGGNITLSDKANVAGDLVIAGGNVIVNAPVKGNIKFIGGDLSVNSQVGGNIDANVSNRLIFGSNTEVSGKVTYKAPKAAIVDKNAKLGSISFTPKEGGSRAGVKAVLTAALLIKLLAWILATWLLLHLRKHFVKESQNLMQAKPWESLGIGLLGLLGWPLVTVLILLTAVGYYVAVILGVFYVLLLLFSALMSAIFLGSLSWHYLSKGQEVANWQVAVLGVVLWQLLAFIPVLGWLVCAVVYLMVMGSLVKIVKKEISIN